MAGSSGSTSSADGRSEGAGRRSGRVRWQCWTPQRQPWRVKQQTREPPDLPFHIRLSDLRRGLLCSPDRRHQVDRGSVLLARTGRSDPPAIRSGAGVRRSRTVACRSGHPTTGAIQIMTLPPARSVSHTHLNVLEPPSIKPFSAARSALRLVRCLPIQQSVGNGHTYAVERLDRAAICRICPNIGSIRTVSAVRAVAPAGPRTCAPSPPLDPWSRPPVPSVRPPRQRSPVAWSPARWHLPRRPPRSEENA